MRMNKTIWESFFGYKKAFILVFIFIFLHFFCQAQNWDIDLLKEINQNRYRPSDTLFKTITDYAPPLSYTIPFFLLGLSLIVKDRLLKVKSIFLINAALVGLFASESLKQIFHRPRPFVTYHFLDKITTANSPSFPSGHTCDAFTLAFSISFAFPKWYVIIPAFTWATLVGYSRMDLGVHYPSDVMGSVVIAALVSWGCFYFYRKREKQLLITKKVD